MAPEAEEQKRQEEITQLRHHITRLDEQIASQAEERKKEQSKHMLQMEMLKRSADDELRRCTVEYEMKVWKLKRKIQVLEGERISQRQGIAPNTNPLASEQIRYMQEPVSVQQATVARTQHLGRPTTQTEGQRPSGSAGASHISYPKTLPTRSTAASSNVSHKGADDTNISDMDALREVYTLLQNQLSTANNNYTQVHRRLKEAANDILYLSIEKQQLIDTGNRLRGELRAAQQEKKSSAEKQEPHDPLCHCVSERLYALEQLYRQLTTKEMQNALRQTKAKQTVSGTNRQEPAVNSSTEKPWIAVQRYKESAEDNKIKENCALPGQSQGLVDTRSRFHSNASKLQFSSLESLHSLNELWATLDREKSSSSFSEGYGEHSIREVTGSPGADVVHGVAAPIHTHVLPEIQQKNNPGFTIGNSRQELPQPKVRTTASAKIRNYNIKD